MRQEQRRRASRPRLVKLCQRRSYVEEGVRERHPCPTTGQEVRLWDVTDCHTPRVLSGVAASHPAVIRSVAFSPRTDVLGTGADDQTVALWPVGDGPRIAVLDVSDAVTTVAITAEGGLLTALDETGTATLWTSRIRRCRLASVSSPRRGRHRHLNGRSPTPTHQSLGVCTSWRGRASAAGLLDVLIAVLTSIVETSMAAPETTWVPQQ